MQNYKHHELTTCDPLASNHLVVFVTEEIAISAGLFVPVAMLFRMRTIADYLHARIPGPAARCRR